MTNTILKMYLLINQTLNHLHNFTYNQITDIHINDINMHLIKENMYNYHLKNYLILTIVSNYLQ